MPLPRDDDPFGEAVYVPNGTPDNLARFVQIEQRLRDLKAEEETLRSERSTLEQLLLDEWADRGQQNAKVGGLTVYIRQDFVCSKRSEVPTEQVVAALRQIGLDAMVAEGYNANTLKARVKEWLVDDAVPEQLQPLLQWQTIPRLVSLKST